jgi:hypothetical protein
MLTPQHLYQLLILFLTLEILAVFYLVGEHKKIVAENTRSTIDWESTYWHYVNEHISFHDADELESLVLSNPLPLLDAWIPGVRVDVPGFDLSDGVKMIETSYTDMVANMKKWER